ncbi:hypothetical protein F6V25_09740 [Oryzomonas japonica]|uniref:Uncharacterized protein n=1 Tax=Oryzomonas japonica TaxID=2603858 RepID=A0A7J4ZR31_9BACT|nr:hypothetical protein [Oryzomonas japonica]KAB0665357.1 hypothetical protein F6V25_09740 [Oryzomonas japonica]
MQQDSGKGRQEVSLVGRILSLETMLLLMGVASLVYGIVNGVETSILWGVVIIPGVFILMKVRKKDWQKHWQDLEAEQKAHDGRKNPPSDPPREK